MNSIASIIILTYKRFDSVYDTILSSLEQNYEEIELVIADDGSDSFPKNQIVDFINLHRRSNLVSCLVYSNEKNLGTVKNINEAIKRSTGDYILPMASDDVFYDNNTVSLIVDKLKQSKTGMITCRRLMVDDDNKGIRFMPSRYHEKKIAKLNTPEKQHRAFARGEYYEMASGSSTFYTRNQLQKEGLFDERYRLLEDWPQFLETTKNRILELSYDIIAIRYKQGGISSANSPIIVEDYINMMERELQYARDIFSRRDLQYLQFRKDSFSSNNKIMIYLKHPVSFITRAIYRVQNDLYSRMAERDYYLQQKRNN